MAIARSANAGFVGRRDLLRLAVGGCVAIVARGCGGGLGELPPGVPNPLAGARRFSYVPVVDTPVLVDGAPEEEFTRSRSPRQLASYEVDKRAMRDELVDAVVSSLPGYRIEAIYPPQTSSVPVLQFQIAEVYFGGFHGATIAPHPKAQAIIYMTLFNPDGSTIDSVRADVSYDPDVFDATGTTMRALGRQAGRLFARFLRGRTRAPS